MSKIYLPNDKQSPGKLKRRDQLSIKIYELEKNIKEKEEQLKRCEEDQSDMQFSGGGIFKMCAMDGKIDRIQTELSFMKRDLKKYKEELIDAFFI